jgi:pimeloyl-ACP methyl ester carboxylesterase
MNGASDGSLPMRTEVVVSADGTTIAYRTVGKGPAVLVVPGALAVAADFDAFARELAHRFSVHTIERRGRGESGPQGDDYSIERECEDLAGLQAATAATFLFGHSFGGFIALEAARANKAFAKVAVYEPGVSIDDSIKTSCGGKHRQPCNTLQHASRVSPPRCAHHADRTTRTFDA